MLWQCWKLCPWEAWQLGQCLQQNIQKNTMLLGPHIVSSSTRPFTPRMQLLCLHPMLWLRLEWRVLAAWVPQTVVFASRTVSALLWKMSNFGFGRAIHCPFWKTTHFLLCGGSKPFGACDWWVHSQNRWPPCLHWRSRQTRKQWNPHVHQGPKEWEFGRFGKHFGATKQHKMLPCKIVCLIPMDCESFQFETKFHGKDMNPKLLNSLEVSQDYQAKFNSMHHCYAMNDKGQEWPRWS